MKKEYRFDYETLGAIGDMPQADGELCARAKEACGSAFAPYSGFRVGAAARLRSGLILTGSNQESEVFPAGMCAERTLLFHWQAHHSGSGGSDVGAGGGTGANGDFGDPQNASEATLDPIETIAIASIPGERECYPCGQCRQLLLDTERRQQSPIRIIMCGDATASAVGSARELLPFQFEL
ncbi:MAG: cytidine deaminase [Alistipes sp.]|jgi:cytidine deaminase|nr:cytidine deaminase [Alistipes sp.]